MPSLRRFIVLVMAGAAIMAANFFLSPAVTGEQTGEQTGKQRAVGTSGRADTIIHELDTILGINDGHELIGRRADLHVPIQQRLSDVAFWIGSPDNRLLVVLAEPAPVPSPQQKGHPASITISGIVRALPKPEVVDRWGLAGADRDDLLQRRIYLRAESVYAREPAGTPP